jgi:hypothetical protein
MEQDADTTSPSDRPASVVLTAVLVVVLGTALVDPARLWLLLIPASFLLAAHEAGLLIARWADRYWATGLNVSTPRSGIRVGIGVAGLSLLAYWSGLAGILPAAGLVTAGCFVSGLRRRLRAPGLAGFGWPGIAPATAGIVTGLGWLLAWLWATTPPIFFDELSYHLVVPQRALATGSLPAFPWVFFTLMPHASDVLLAWGMGLGRGLETVGMVSSGGDLGARAMVWGLWIACSLAVWALLVTLTWPKVSVWASPLATCTLAVSPTLWFLATLPFGETCVAIGVVTAAGLLVEPRSPAAREPAPRPWLLVGLALGLVATVKLTGLYWVVAALAAARVAGWRWKDLWPAAGVVAASVAPWWGRAFAYTGNPIYPMAYELLGGRFWGAENQARVMGDVAHRASDLDASGLLRLPWDLVQHPERFGSGADVGAVAVAAMAVVLCLPVLLRLRGVAGRPRRLADMGAVFVLVAASGWLSTSLVTRFFAPAFIVSLVGVAALTLHLRRARLALALSLGLAAGLWGTLRFVNEHSLVFSSRDVALGREAPDAYLARQVDHFAAARFVRGTLPAEARLLFIGETRPYYFARQAVAPTAYDTHPLAGWVRDAPSSDALAHRLAAEGISHVVLNVREFKRLRVSYGLLAFADLGDEASERRLKELPAKLKLLFAENGVYVFEVPRGEPVARAIESGRG